MNQKMPNNKPINKNVKKNSLFPFLFMAILISSIVFLFRNPLTKIHTNTEFQKILVDDSYQFESVNIFPSEKTMQVKGIYYKDDKKYEFETIYPNTEKNYNYIVETINQKIKDPTKGLTIVKPSNFSIWNLLWNILIFVVPFMLIFWLLSKSGPSKGIEFGKSRAKLNKLNTITFKDVAGAKEEKEELSEIVDFLKKPNEYVSLGARVPKGVILVGPPGTGKTLLAKAVAGEAKVPFYTISGSDFIEMFVGVGASRVRSMFKEAKKNAPCIIFIDEIDAVGRNRGPGSMGGHDEREQTLNQLLVEMDGFGTNAGIIIIAATNREDVLDKALLRPGRFDRRISVHLPDVYARIEILKVHARNKKYAKGIDFEKLAYRTPGFTGAQLENVLNEATLLSIRDDSKKVTMLHLDEAVDRVIGGPAKYSKKKNAEERKLVAFHEAGHAVIGLKLADAEIVQKVTIIPRGAAGGYVLMTPKKESFILTKTQMFHKIVSYMGGRVSEKLHFGKENITTGSSDDMKKATSLARAMVTRFGMSDEIGPISLEPSNQNAFEPSSMFNPAKEYGEQVNSQIDKEIKKIILNAEKKAHEIISKHLPKVKLIAEMLLKHETLTAEMIENIDKYNDVSKPVEKKEVKKEEVEKKEPKKLKEKVKKALKQESLDFNNKK